MALGGFTDPPWSFNGAFGFLLRRIFRSKSARKDRGGEFYLFLGISFAISPLPSLRVAEGR